MLITMSPRRHYNKWTVNEILQLQREYELLEMSVQDIAKIHNRTVNAIVSKLMNENFISSFNEARGYVADDMESVGSESTCSEYVVPTFSPEDNTAVICERIGTLEARMEKMFVMFSKLTDHLIDNNQISKNFVQRQYINI
jgi:hypothetical protein